MTNRVGSKNYFYDIKITTPDKSTGRVDILPEEVKRLIDSVVISRVMSNDKAKSDMNAATITFKEHYYAPENDTFLPMKEGGAKGLITNRPGSILDLRFDSEKGFTFVTRAELEEQRTKKSRTQNNKKGPVVFLFQANNIIEITWGYSDPFKSATERFRIQTVTVAGGGGGHGAVTVQCLSDGSKMAKLKPEVGVPFWEKVSNKPMSLKQVLFKLAKSGGMQLEFDGKIVTKFPKRNDTQDPDRRKGDDSAPMDITAPFLLPRGMSLHEYARELAGQFNSTIGYITNEIKGEEDADKRHVTITRFIHNDLIYSGTKFRFEYMNGEGNMLNYNISSSSNLYSPAVAASGIDNKGESKSLTQFNERLVIKDQIDPYDSKEVTDFMSGMNKVKPVGVSETIPTTSKDAIKQFAYSNLEKRNYPNSISFSTIGDPDYEPALMQIDNIGARFSAPYRIYNVVHTLSGGGYTCSFAGETRQVGEGGFKPDERGKQNEDVITPILVDKNK